MYETQYVLLFIAGLGLSAAAYLDYAQGYTSVLGIFVWFVIGNASVAVEFWDGSGASHVATSISLAWLCYANAAMHAFLFIAALREYLTDDDQDPQSPDELAERIEPSGLQGTSLTAPQGNNQQ